jgi:hypothetical protein
LWVCQTHTVDDEVFWRKDGTSFPVEYTSTPIKDEIGKLQTNFRFISSHAYKTAEIAGEIEKAKAAGTLTKLAY